VKAKHHEADLQLIVARHHKSSDKDAVLFT